MKSSITAIIGLMLIEKAYIIIETWLWYGNPDCQSEDNYAIPNI
jgi:hypothetical protein